MTILLKFTQKTHSFYHINHPKTTGSACDIPEFLVNDGYFISELDRSNRASELDHEEIVVDADFCDRTVVLGLGNSRKKSR